MCLFHCVACCFVLYAFCLCSAFDCVVLCDCDVRIVFAMFFLLVCFVFVSWLLLADVCVCVSVLACVCAALVCFSRVDGDDCVCLCCAFACSLVCVFTCVRDWALQARIHKQTFTQASNQT